MTQQLLLFEPVSSHKDSHTHPLVYWKVFIDGAARKNPGPAGVGMYMLKNNEPYLAHGYTVGIKTNNQAEYLALLIAIYYLQKNAHENDPIVIVSDSQLLVRQMEGAYKAKHPELKPLHTFAKKILQNYCYDVEHVMREYNTEADALANKGIDEKIAVPAVIKDWLHSHEIVI